MSKVNLRILPPQAVQEGYDMATIKCYETKDGNKLYKFQIYIGTDPLTGKRLKTTRSGFKTKKEAQLAISRLQLEIEQGTFKKTSNETFKDVYNLWIEQYKISGVKENSITKTIGIFNNHILPLLGENRINQIDVMMCQKCVNTWFEKIKKYSAIKAYAAQILDLAITLGMITVNPMQLVKVPRKTREINEGKIKFYTKEQLNKFMDHLEEEDNSKAFSLLWVLAFTGMRLGEVSALTWNDINFTTNDIKINKTLAIGEKGRLYIQSTKTKTSTRIISIDDDTKEVLKKWKIKQKQDCLILGFNTLQPDQLVFSNQKNSFLASSTIKKWMTLIQEKYGLPRLTPHGLRHTHCSLLFEANASIKEVQERLGHSSIESTMNVYAHVSKKAKEGTAEKFSQFMKSGN